METGTSAQAAGLVPKKLEFKYDYMGRRVKKRVTVAGTLTMDDRYVYSGWNVIAELNSSNAVKRHFFWGLDVSGTITGAGGVGGLLLIQDGDCSYLPSYDGNGNLTALNNASDGSFGAIYEYGPFGELLRMEGGYAQANPFRFSTKWADIESGLNYYGLRYYSARLGRFISRDPIGEGGGLNLYGFCHNDGVNNSDVLGADELPTYVLPKMIIPSNPGSATVPGWDPKWPGGDDDITVLPPFGITGSRHTIDEYLQESLKAQYGIMMDHSASGLLTTLNPLKLPDATTTKYNRVETFRRVGTVWKVGNKYYTKRDLYRESKRLNKLGKVDKAEYLKGIIDGRIQDPSQIAIVVATSTVSAEPTSGKKTVPSIGWGLSGTLFSGLGGLSLGGSANITFAKNGDPVLQLSGELVPMEGGGLALYASTGPSFGAAEALESRFSFVASTAEHYEVGAGVGEVLSASFEKDDSSWALSPPTSFKMYGKGGAGGAIYAGHGTAHIVTVNIPIPQPQYTPPPQYAGFFYSRYGW